MNPNDLPEDLELLLLSAPNPDDVLTLASPSVGLFRTRLERGSVVAPGTLAGTLEQLGEARGLRVPAPARGFVVALHGERSAQPVGHGSPLLTLEPLSGDHATSATAEDDETRDQPAVRVQQAGRFYQRASPTAEPFVKAGDRLEQGTVVGLVEVMKTFSQVRWQGEPATAGDYLIADGTEVERGTAVLEIV